MKTTAITLLVLATAAIPTSARDYGHVGFPTPGTDELSYPFVTAADSSPSRVQRSALRSSRSMFSRRRVSRSVARSVAVPTTTPRVSPSRGVVQRRVVPPRRVIQPRRVRAAGLFVWLR